MTNTWQHQLRHYTTLVLGILIMAMSIALAKIATLGTSPISSVPNVLSIITPLTIGQNTMIFMTLVVVLEAIVLGRDFSWRNVLQLVPTIIFSALIDFFMTVFSFLTPQTYWAKAILTLISTVCLAWGVFFEVNSRAIVMAGEGIAAALAFRFHQPFAKMKVRTDITMVAMAIGLAFIFSHRLIGVREGTLVAAILTGRIIGWIEAHFSGLQNWLQH
jgi:uncharacterized membrane protein YczE